MKKLFYLCVVVFGLAVAQIAGASTIYNSQETIGGGTHSLFSEKTESFTTTSAYSADRLEIMLVDGGGDAIHLKLKTDVGAVLATCNITPASGGWQGCDITPTALTISTSYQITAQSDGGYAWYYNTSNIYTYRIYGNLPAPTPDTFQFVNLPATFLADISQYVPTAFTSLWVLIALIVGLPLAFWVIKKVIQIAK